jgi:hypothetical protein
MNKQLLQRRAVGLTPAKPVLRKRRRLALAAERQARRRTSSTARVRPDSTDRRARAPRGGSPWLLFSDGDRCSPPSGKSKQRRRSCRSCGLPWRQLMIAAVNVSCGSSLEATGWPARPAVLGFGGERLTSATVCSRAEFLYKLGISGRTCERV